MPVINKIKLPNKNYSPVLAFMIDCNSGDNTKWQYIESLSDFYKKYNTYGYSMSYEFATNLLSLGYKIIVKNKNTQLNYKNIRIFKNGQYTYIDINKDYTSNIAINTELNITNLLSFDIIIVDKLIDQSYVLINNGSYNILFWWNISNKKDPPIPTEYYYKLICMDSLLIQNFINKLKELSFKVEQLNNKIRVYNFSDLSIIKNSSSNIMVDYTNKNSSYDALAYYYDTIKLVDIVSKIPSTYNDIKFKINFDGIKFSIFIYKYSSDNVIIYDEYFSDININNLLKKVNLRSSLIKIIVYTNQLTDLTTGLLGSFVLKRNIDTDIKVEPKYEELLENFHFDIYIDLYTEKISDGNYLFFSKNKNSQNKNLVIFEDNDIVLKDNKKLPIMFAFLYSYICNYSFLGSINFKFTLESYTNDNIDNDLINKVQFDNFNYYIDKCRIKNKEVSVIIVPILLSNYLKRILVTNINETDLIFILDNFKSYMNSNIVKNIKLINFDNSVVNKLKIHIELQLTYKSIDLIEDIKLDLLY